MSRWAVAIVFPMFMVAVMNIRSVILFNRGRKQDHEVHSSSEIIIARAPKPAFAC